MAPQREGGDEEERQGRPQLATSLQGGSGSEEREAGVALDGEGSACETDAELTSLSWLHSANLLQGLQRQLGQAQPASGPKQAGPSQGKTSGGADEMYNPSVHRHAKPPYSFSCLIFMAIEDSPSKALPVKDIYNWIFSHFPYFRNAPNGWRNSIRHNLSLSKCFYKVDKGQNLAKGSLWCVDPKYRHHLLHSLNKTPNAHYHQGVRLPTFNPPAHLTPHNDVNDQKKETEEVTCRIQPLAPPPIDTPILFQYSTKRVATSVKNPEEDAAVTMLALKNGSVLATPLAQDTPTVVRIDKHVHCEYAGEAHLSRAKGDASRVSCEIIIPASLPVLSSAPNKDHTYSTMDEAEAEVAEEQPLELTTKARAPPVVRWERTPSPARKRKWRTEPRRKWLKRRGRGGFGAEEQKVADGADALLNLAGIVTSGAPHDERRPPRRQRKPSKRNLRHLVG